MSKRKAKLQPPSPIQRVAITPANLKGLFVAMQAGYRQRFGDERLDNILAEAHRVHEAVQAMPTGKGWDESLGDEEAVRRDASHLAFLADEIAGLIDRGAWPKAIGVMFELGCIAERIDAWQEKRDAWIERHRKTASKPKKRMAQAEQRRREFQRQYQIEREGRTHRGAILKVAEALKIEERTAWSIAAELGLRAKK